MEYTCATCGWKESLHPIIQQRWVQLTLFGPNPFKNKRGYRIPFFSCMGFKLSRKARREKNSYINHSIPAIFVFAGGFSRVVDIGG